MTRYAADTEVSPEKSRAEIEKILSRYGATHFGYASTPESASIGFQAKGRRVRFSLPLPPRKGFLVDARGSSRSAAQVEAAIAKATRQRWRALALTIKAKLEAAECGISTFESEFLAHIVLPNGKTMGEVALPQIEQAYQTGDMPPLLGYETR